MRSRSLHVIVSVSLFAPLLAFEWTEAPESREVRRGKDVVLNCDVSGEYLWMSWEGKTAARESAPLFYLPYEGIVFDKVFDDQNFRIVKPFHLQLLVSRER